MLRKIVWGVIVVPLALALVALAVVNRQTVRLVLDPLSPSAPALALDAPFFLFLIAALAAGVIIGGAVTWMRQGRWRRLARQNAREAAALRQERDRLNRQIDALSQPQLPHRAAE